MKTMMKIFALMLFMAGSVIFVGCGENTTTAPDADAVEAGASEAGSDGASTEMGAGNVATVSFKLSGLS